MLKYLNVDFHHNPSATHLKAASFFGTKSGMEAVTHLLHTVGDLYRKRHTVAPDCCAPSGAPKSPLMRMVP